MTELKPTLQLLEAGQSVWYDNIQRSLLKNGELAGMVERGEIRGVTSNPTIFMNAIVKPDEYDSYRIRAQFENVGGLKPGAPVSMAGVTIGRVESIGYEMQLFKAVVTLRIDARYDQIPNDSDAGILTAGLLGGQYVGITPGSSEEPYRDGDSVEFVQDAIVLEHLISKYLFSQAGKGGDSAAEPAPQE